MSIDQHDIRLRSGRGNVWGDNLGLQQALDVPRCYIVQGATQTITTAAITSLGFNTTTPTLDTDGLFNGSLPTRVTIRTAGFYDIKGHVFWAAGGAGLRDAWLLKNGAIRIGQDRRPASATDLVTCNPSASATLNAGDYIELQVYQDSGVPFATSNVDGTSAELALCLIST